MFWNPQRRFSTITCAWCGKTLGVQEGSQSEAHGLCPGCYTRLLWSLSPRLLGVILDGPTPTIQALKNQGKRKEV